MAYSNEYLMKLSNGKKFLRITLFNKDGSLRWDLILVEESKDYWSISEISNRSLFSNPLAKSNSPGDTLNKFMLIETELIEGL